LYRKAAAPYKMERKAVRYNSIQSGPTEVWGIDDDLSVHDLDSVHENAREETNNHVASMKVLSDENVLQICGLLLLMTIALAARMFVFFFVEKDHPTYKHLRTDIEIMNTANNTQNNLPSI
jgi:hypothetical protein